MARPNINSWLSSNHDNNKAKRMSKLLKGIECKINRAEKQSLKLDFPEVTRREQKIKKLLKVEFN